MAFFVCGWSLGCWLERLSRSLGKVASFRRLADRIAEKAAHIVSGFFCLWEDFRLLVRPPVPMPREGREFPPAGGSDR